MSDNYEMRIADLEEQIAELEKENKKYREALEEILDTHQSTSMVTVDGKYFKSLITARQALNK